MVLTIWWSQQETTALHHRWVTYLKLWTLFMVRIIGKKCEIVGLSAWFSIRSYLVVILNSVHASKYGGITLDHLIRQLLMMLWMENMKLNINLKVQCAPMFIMFVLYLLCGVHLWWILWHMSLDCCGLCFVMRVRRMPVINKFFIVL